MVRAMRTLAWCGVFICMMGTPVFAEIQASSGRTNELNSQPLKVQALKSVELAAAKSKQTKPQKKVSPAKKKPAASAPAPKSKNKPASQAQSQKPVVTADAAVLMDVATGDVLFDKQAHKRRAPASTTKIMTAILGLELGRPDEVVTVSDKAAQVGESTIHLDPGEKLTLYELITGALIKSGNDACVAISEQVAGSEAKFVQLMNQKALILGATDTHFVNTNGLPNKDHYSSAYDLALFARYGLQLPTFSSITRQKETEIHFLQPDFFMDLRNTNKLLWSYEYADGVKTGTTNAAGKCLVASATKDGRQLVAVLLHAGDRFGDAKKLLEWGFSNTETYHLANAGETVGEFPIDGISGIPAFLAGPVEISLPKDERPKITTKIVWTRQPVLPLQPGETLGAYEVWLGAKRLTSVPLLSEQGIEKDFFGRVKKLAA